VFLKSCLLFVKSSHKRFCNAAALKMKKGQIRCKYGQAEKSRKRFYACISIKNICFPLAESGKIPSYMGKD